MSDTTISYQAIMHVLNDGFNFLRAFMPTLLGALVATLAGWILSDYVGRAIARALTAFGFESVAERSGVTRFLSQSGSQWNGSKAVGEICKWVLRLLTIQIAATILNMPQITEVIHNVIMFTPKVFVALVILVAGMMLGNFTSKAVRGSVAEMGLGNQAFFSNFIYMAIVGFSILAALSHLEIAPAIINTLFIGLVSSLGLAFGLAFGLGGKDVAGEITRNWYERSRKTESTKKRAA